jgi:hypothetical protein
MYTFWKKRATNNHGKYFLFRHWPSGTVAIRWGRHCWIVVRARRCIHADGCHFKHFRQTHCNITTLSEANRTLFHLCMCFHIHLPLFFDISKSRSFVTAANCTHISMNVLTPYEVRNIWMSRIMLR